MIPSAQEIIYRVYGAAQLARFNAGGAQYFDSAPQAALRSFFAAALVAPAFIIVQILSISASGLKSDEDPLVIALVFALYYVLIWVASPVIIYRICVTIDRENAFFRYLSANNWSDVIATHLWLVVTLLGAAGILPEALGVLPGIGVFVYLLFFQWFIVRHCLDVSPLAAVGFVALQVVVNELARNIAFNIVFQSPG